MCDECVQAHGDLCLASCVRPPEGYSGRSSFVVISGGSFDGRGWPWAPAGFLCRGKVGLRSMSQLPTATAQETDDGIVVKCPSCNTKFKVLFDEDLTYASDFSEDDLSLASRKSPLQPEIDRLMYDKALLEEKNRQLLEALEEVRQKGIQNSSQLVGRILERDMFDVLSEEFTTDTITRVSTKGGDILFTVRAQSGKAGVILLK
jgi:hypothetical protein